MERAAEVSRVTMSLVGNVTAKQLLKITVIINENGSRNKKSILINLFNLFMHLIVCIFIIYLYIHNYMYFIDYLFIY